jgi:hypothetical protein
MRPGALARWTDASEDRVMTRDVEPALLRRHVAGDQGDRDIDIEEHAAELAVDVIVPVDTRVVAARLVREGELLNQPMFREEMERPVDRPVADAGIGAPDALEDLAGCQVSLGTTNLFQHCRALGRIPKPWSWHLITELENESH